MSRYGTSRLAALSLGLASLASPLAATPTHDTWDLDQVIYATPKDPSVNADLVKTHSMQAVIAVLQQHKIEFQRQHKQIGPRQLPSDVYTVISGLPPGEPFIVPSGDQTVVSVILGHETSVDPPPN